MLNALKKPATIITTYCFMLRLNALPPLVLLKNNRPTLLHHSWGQEWVKGMRIQIKRAAIRTHQRKTETEKTALSRVRKAIIELSMRDGDIREQPPILD